jgi:hypothetical protein
MASFPRLMESRRRKSLEAVEVSCAADCLARAGEHMNAKTTLITAISIEGSDTVTTHWYPR